ncbi:UNVERIFIED_CONTAM: hypothetical protein HDU68_005556 [Siphonaria sp. JEL0065]|nr:hypothetical protein HDU68_005556 [Siphonaria sp. JEL0065]
MNLFWVLSSLLLGSIQATSLRSSKGEQERVEIEIVHSVPDSECSLRAQDGDQLGIHYTGFLEDGTQIDTSFKNRYRPYVFTMAMGLVIKGWDEGLRGTCIGEKRRLTIPPSLAYGDKGKGAVPPGATLVFDTEVITIIPKDQELSSFQFTLGAGQVIKGWDQGLNAMCVGEKRVLTIPASLGYGERGAGGVIPGTEKRDGLTSSQPTFPFHFYSPTDHPLKTKRGATLVFDVELLDILNSRSEL